MTHFDTKRWQNNTRLIRSKKLMSKRDFYWSGFGRTVLRVILKITTSIHIFRLLLVGIAL